MKTLLHHLKNFFLGIPALLVSLLAVLKSCPPCPVCMPKYAAILSFFGIPLAAYSHYLVPVMLVSMTFTLGTLFWQVKKSSVSSVPLILAATAAALILTGQYLVHFPPLTYGAMALFLTGVLLGQRNMKKKKKVACCAAHAKQQTAL